MEGKISLKEAIDSTLSAVHRGADLFGEEMLEEFMHLVNAILDNPQEVLNMSDTSKLALAINAMVATDMMGSSIHSSITHKDYKTGLVICATGFYALTKAIKTNNIPRSYYRAMVEFLHFGRMHFAELVKYSTSWEPNDNIHDEPLSHMEHNNGVVYEQESIVMALELAYINRCKSVGCGDGLEGFERQISSISKLREQMYKNAPIAHTTPIVRVSIDLLPEYEERLYNYIENNLKSSRPFEFGF